MKNPTDYNFEIFLCDELGLEWEDDFEIVDDTTEGWWECLMEDDDDFETFLDDELGV